MFEPPVRRLSDFVTPERLDGLIQLASRANLFQLLSLLLQSLILYLILNDIPFWIAILEMAFLGSVAVSLIVSLSKNPTAQHLRLSFTFAKITLVLGVFAVLVALLFASNPFSYVFLLPGPFLGLFNFFGRRAGEQEVKFRILRNAKAGDFGNLEGIVADLSPYGYQPSELSWKRVFTWAVFFEALTIPAVFRARAASSSHIPVTSPVFYTFLTEAVLVTAAIGIIIGIIMTETERRWTKAVTGHVKLDALEKSHLWFYGNNGAFHCYKLFDRPMVTEMDDQSLVVAHWPASFYIRTGSSGDYETVLSVLQNTANYGVEGRKVSNKA